jgi:hypothetical protein
MDGSIWGLAIVGGPILLGLVLIFVIVGNRRRRNPGDVARTEQATKDLYRKMDAEDKASGSG